MRHFAVYRSMPPGSYLCCVVMYAEQAVTLVAVVLRVAGCR